MLHNKINSQSNFDAQLNDYVKHKMHELPDEFFLQITNFSNKFLLFVNIVMALNFNERNKK